MAWSSSGRSNRAAKDLISGAATGREEEQVLAGGTSHATELDASQDAPLLGQLTSATVHPDLTGEGRPTAVVGSTDGWLYGIDPCSGSVDFAHSLGAPVGEAIFGDTDGDGRDEILVMAEDGFVYALRNFEIDAPESVLDTDPWSDDEGDIRNVDTEATLEATWTAVAGAVRYEVAVVDESNWYVGDDFWIDAGDATRLTITDLPLQDGVVYRVAVRAIASDGGRSVDTVSNGVRVHITERSYDVPEHGGCGCDGGGTPPSTAALLLLVAGLALRRRRRA